MEPLEGEGRTSAVAGEALDALTVRALDAYGGVDAEPAGALPREHVLGDLLVQEAVPAEVTKDALLHGDLQPLPVVWL